MSLIDAIHRTEVRLQQSIGSELSERPKLAKLADKLEAKFTDGVAVPTAEDIAVTAERLSSSVSIDSTDQLTRKDWKKAAWCLWFKDNPLAQNSYFLSRYLDNLDSWRRRSLVKPLIIAYLQDFSEGQPGIDLVARRLQRIVDNWEWAWRERSREFQLFDPKKAPAIISQICLNPDTSLEDTLRAAGISGGQLSSGGMAEAAFEKSLLRLVRSFEEAGQSSSTLERILEWASDSGEIRFPNQKVYLAEALLRPWFDRTPDDDTKSRIEEFLLRHYGDPRLRPGEWQGVSDDARRVLMKWLAEAALEQFLDIVDRFAVERMWKYRRAFWSAYMGLGYIPEAWVVFAKHGAKEVSRVFDKKAIFGRIDGSGVDPAHAVLLMKMGGLTIADWSHNGKCHIWLPGNRNAPNLYERSYDRDDFVVGSDNDGGTIHSSAQGGFWQGRVANFIQINTGISIPRTQYMP
jgi:hypothetical protein